MNRAKKIEEILSLMMGQKPDQEEQGIPIDWWIWNPAGIAKKFNQWNKAMGIPKRYTAEECTCFKH